MFCQGHASILLLNCYRFADDQQMPASQVLSFDTVTTIFVGLDISIVLWRNVDWVVSVQFAGHFGMVLAYCVTIERQGCAGIHAHMHLAIIHFLTADVVVRSLAVEQWPLI